jgi:hypothetical protein
MEYDHTAPTLDIDATNTPSIKKSTLVVGGAAELATKFFVPVTILPAVGFVGVIGPADAFPANSERKAMLLNTNIVTIPKDVNLALVDTIISPFSQIMYIINDKY